MNSFGRGNLGGEEDQMTWTFTNLIIQIITGILGGHAAASAAEEHSLGRSVTPFQARSAGP
jgi:hypothetical protein